MLKKMHLYGDVGVVALVVDWCLESLSGWRLLVVRLELGELSSHLVRVSRNQINEINAFLGWFSFLSTCILYISTCHCDDSL